MTGQKVRALSIATQGQGGPGFLALAGTDGVIGDREAAAEFVLFCPVKRHMLSEALQIGRFDADAGLDQHLCHVDIWGFF
ncbi:hypothetical protein RXV86_04555 [Alisedimentitalea sp. MJ-SS2]|uniref:hypothetical protein n=1 Tax=Aliisedimentitalea sp. MJ-SS2 TaxID=3049795 RepID=UPI0029121A49|nr:hypothetical protein [Alisedimentitalea sp. MJ-SS2]MDU8926650.1 hypothetical protein [Alisedimentitalea sp. MJ-SS2]